MTILGIVCYLAALERYNNLVVFDLESVSNQSHII